MGTTASHPVSAPAKYPKAPEPLSPGILVVACPLPPPTLSLSYSDQVSVPGSTTLSCSTPTGPSRRLSTPSWFSPRDQVPSQIQNADFSTPSVVPSPPVEALSPPSISTPHFERSKRERRPKKMYDQSTGKYVLPTS